MMKWERWRSTLLKIASRFIHAADQVVFFFPILQFRAVQKKKKTKKNISDIRHGTLSYNLRFTSWMLYLYSVNSCCFKFKILKDCNVHVPICTFHNKYNYELAWIGRITIILLPCKCKMIYIFVFIKTISSVFCVPSMVRKEPILFF